MNANVEKKLDQAVKLIKEKYPTADIGWHETIPYKEWYPGTFTVNENGTQFEVTVKYSNPMDQGRNGRHQGIDNDTWDIFVKDPTLQILFVDPKSNDMYMDKVTRLNQLPSRLIGHGKIKTWRIENLTPLKSTPTVGKTPSPSPTSKHNDADSVEQTSEEETIRALIPKEPSYSNYNISEIKVLEMLKGERFQNRLINQQTLGHWRNGKELCKYKTTIDVKDDRPRLKAVRKNDKKYWYRLEDIKDFVKQMVEGGYWIN